MRYRRIPEIALAIAATLLVAACGSSNNTTTGTGTGTGTGGAGSSGGSSASGTINGAGSTLAAPIYQQRCGDRQGDRGDSTVSQDHISFTLVYFSVLAGPAAEVLLACGRGVIQL